MDILILNSMGRPGVLVRPGWETVDVAGVVVCGLVAGLVYGAILGLMISPRGLRKNAVFIVPGTFLLGAALYATGVLLSIRVMDIFPWLGAHAVVFLAGLAIARLGAGPLPAQSH